MPDCDLNSPASTLFNITRIEFETLNKLCELLDCEPADIFIYTKDNKIEDNSNV